MNGKKDLDESLRRKNVNMVVINIKIKVEEEFPTGIEGDDDDVPKKESSSACDKYRYKELMKLLEIEQVNTKIFFVRRHRIFPRTCSGQLLVNLLTVGQKISNQRLTVSFNCKIGEKLWRIKRLFRDHGSKTVLRSWFCCHLFLTANPKFHKFMFRYSSDHQTAFKECKIL